MARRRSRCRRSANAPRRSSSTDSSAALQKGVKTRLFAMTGAGSASWKRWSQLGAASSVASASRKAIVALINENGPGVQQPLLRQRPGRAEAQRRDAARAGDRHAVGQ